MWILAVTMGVLVILAFIAFSIEERTRTRNGISMSAECMSTPGLIQVLLFGDDSESLSESLFAIIQEARCPTALRVTLVETVPSFEDESETLRLYKRKSDLRGNYSTAFMDHIQVHQTMNTCTAHEALHLAPRLRPLTLLASQNSRFLKHWDLDMVQAFEGLKGPMFCGAAEFDGNYMPAYTQASYDSVKHPSIPTIITQPLRRTGPSVPCVWAALPILVRTNDLKKLNGCNGSDVALSITNSTLSVWTSRNPVALLTEFERSTFSEHDYKRIDTRGKSKALAFGVFDNASQLEVIMKYGSIGALQWAIHT